MALMKGASVRDWWWIRNFDLLSEKLAVYNYESNIQECKIPWPIVWVCTRYSRKHIFAKRKLPDLRWMHEELNQFCGKMKWRWIFRHHPSPQPSVKLSLNSRCFTPVDAGLQFWLDNFCRRMVCTACSGLKKLKWHKDWWSNVTPLVRLGFRMLKTLSGNLFPLTKLAVMSWSSKKMRKLSMRKSSTSPCMTSPAQTILWWTSCTRITLLWLSKWNNCSLMTNT